jgi:hypothetical protein
MATDFRPHHPGVEQAGVRFAADIFGRRQQRFRDAGDEVRLHGANAARFANARQRVHTGLETGATKDKIAARESRKC